MPRLHDIQQGFADALFAGRHQELAEAIVPEGSALRSLALYRRLIRHNYTQVLKITYPVLLRFVGEHYFEVFARGYVKHYPSTSGDLFPFGRHLPRFLETISAPALLVELAKLEWACHEVHQAPDALALSDEELRLIGNEAPSRVIFRLSPASRRLSFSFPVHRIWLAAQPGAPAEEGGELTLPRADTVVIVTRGEGRVWVTPVAPLDSRLLDLMDEGQTLADVEARAMKSDPSFDFPRFLAMALHLRLLTGYTLKETP